MSLHAPYVYRLATELNETLRGMVIEHLYSLDKKQLYFQFTGKGSSFNMVFRIENSGCFFSFPEQLSASVSNRQDRFTAVHHQKIVSIEGHAWERSFHLEMENGARLAFYCYGRNAHVVLLEGEQSESFRQKNPGDFLFEHNRLNTLASGQWTLSEEVLKKADAFLQKEFQAYHGTGQEWLERYLSGPVFLNKDEKEDFFLSPFKGNDCLQSFSQLHKALDQWSRLSLARAGFLTRKEQLVQQYSREKKSLEQRLKALSTEREKAGESKNYRHWGDLILAHLYLIMPGDKQLVADDYLTGQPVTIRLQETLSGQENAQRYYRKAKNQYKETEKLDKLEAELSERLEIASLTLAGLEMAEGLKELRPFLKEEKQKEKTLGRSPYHAFDYLGYSILVGKQANDNDTLTLKVAKKDDLWLHARDVTGSHVVIRKKAGESIPEKVIDYACGLALWFSKRKTESLAPVIVTEKKFVRKRKGDPPGAVVVEKESVRMAAPLKPESTENGDGK